MMNKHRERKKQSLNVIANGLLTSNPQYASEIREVQRLYNEGKIGNYETAKKTIDNLTAKNPKLVYKLKRSLIRNLGDGLNMD